MKSFVVAVGMAVLVVGCAGPGGPSAGSHTQPADAATPRSSSVAPTASLSFASRSPLTPAASSLSTLAPSPRPLTITSDGPIPIDPGTYSATSPFLVPLTFTVPAGWSASVGGPYAVFLKQTYGSDDMDFSIFDKVYADPCHVDKGLMSPLPGSSVDNLVAALSSMPSMTLSDVTDTSVDGVAGKQLTVTAPSITAGCRLTDQGQFRLWELPLGATNDIDPGDSQQITILEVDGQRLVISDDGQQGDQGILGSISFLPPS